MSFEVIEAGGPGSAVGLEPVVDLPQRFGVEPVPATLRVRAHRHRADLAHHLEMLGHRGLREPEVLGEIPDEALPGQQPLGDVPPMGPLRAYGGWGG